MIKQNRCSRALAALALMFLAGSVPSFAEAPTGLSLPCFDPQAEQAPPADAVSGATETAPGPDYANPEPTLPDAESGATPGAGKSPDPDFFGLAVPLDAHRIAGYASGGLLLGAGVIGLIRFGDLMSRAHEHREGEEDDGFSDECVAIIHDEWTKGQTLRWTHVGLVISGESLYLFDGITGVSLMGKGGSPTRAGKIHRNAFFIHAALMAADVALGFLLTDALDRGDHAQVTGFGAAHAGIGLAIPVVIIGSGLAADFLR